MLHLTHSFPSLFSLRVLVLAVVAWLLLGGPLPQFILDARDKTQTYLFRLALLISDLPQPQTHITVVHVPDAEYERWLVDLSSAASLELLFNHMADDALVGFVLEQPLVTVQPAAEALLQDIQQRRKSREPLYQDVQNLLARRELLISALTSKRLVLGLMDQSSHYYRRIPVQESFVQYPQLVRDWLWPWPEPLPASVVSPLLQYFPIDSAPSQERRLASLEGDKVVPMFPLQFWAASQGQHRPGVAAKVLSWRRDRGFSLGTEQIRTSVAAEIVPIYGSFSGIRASMRQITLGAALAADNLSGWILLGRDGSPTLEQSAQVIASLGDRAFLHQPAWWGLAQKACLALLAIYLLVLLPALPLRWVMGLAITAVLALAGAQVLGQILSSFWLPVGELLILGAAGSALMLVWRWQRHEWLRLQSRADQSCHALARRALEEGRLQDALIGLRDCRPTFTTLDIFYRIADAYEQQDDLPGALAALHELRRRRLFYKDVLQRMRRLRVSLAYRREHEAQAPVPAS